MMKINPNHNDVSKRKMLNKGEIVNSKQFKTLLSKYKTFIFLSPHYDDAVLSCGTLLNTLHHAHKQSVVITIFTRATARPYSAHANIFMLSSGFSDAFDLFTKRDGEDKNAAALLHYKRYILNHIDAAWRKTYLYSRWKILQIMMFQIPYLIHIYPTAKKQFSGAISQQDASLIVTIQRQCKNTIKQYKSRNILLLAPLGIGGHADHVIIRNIAKSLHIPTLFWEDFPYNINKASYADFQSTNTSFSLALSVQTAQDSKKFAAIRLYTSQMPVLFPTGDIPKIPEKYYWESN